MTLEISVVSVINVEQRRCTCRGHMALSVWWIAMLLFSFFTFLLSLTIVALHFPLKAFLNSINFFSSKLGF